MPWVDEALCAQTDPEIFHPGKGQSSRDAAAICGRCPVTADCLDWALRHKESGIWGGTSENQRKHLRRELGIRLTPAPPAPLRIPGGRAA